MIYSVECRKCGKERDLTLPLSEHGNWPICCGKKTYQVIKAKQIVPDIQPYMTVAADNETGKRQYITSRVKHKEFLKRNRLIEIGNEVQKQREVQHDFGPREKLREDIRRATRQVLGT